MPKEIIKDEKEFFFEKYIVTYTLQTKIVTFGKSLRTHYYVTWITKGMSTNIEQELTEQEYNLLLNKLKEKVLLDKVEESK